MACLVQLDRDQAPSGQPHREAADQLRDDIRHFGTIQSLDAQTDYGRALRLSYREDRMKIRGQRDNGRVSVAGQLENLRVSGAGQAQFADVIAPEPRCTMQRGGISRHALVED